MWTRIRAGKPWAAGMSKDTRDRAWGTLATPTGMKPASSRVVAISLYSAPSSIPLRKRVGQRESLRKRRGQEMRNVIQPEPAKDKSVEQIRYPADCCRP